MQIPCFWKAVAQEGPLFESIGTKCGQESFLKGNPQCDEQKGGGWAAGSQGHTRLCSLVTLLESALNTHSAGFYTWAKIVKKKKSEYPYLSVYLSIYISIYISIYLSIYISFLYVRGQKGDAPEGIIF